LFRFLRRSLDLARLANATGRPAGEILERHLEHRRRGWNRREVLAASGLAAAGLALGCRTPTPAMRTGEPVVIVGAGMAGLLCGYRLMQAGVPVRLIEAQERTGGRMWSLRDRFPERQVCELGGELVDGNHLTMHRLCAELCLTLDDFDGDDPALARDVWHFGGRRIPDAEVVAAFRPIAAQMDEVWAGLPGEVVSHRQPTDPAERALAERIDRRSIAEWLDGAGAEGWFRGLLDVGYTTEYGLEIDRQSAWNLLMLIDSNPDPFRIFGDSDERFHVRGGNDQVTTALASALGDRIETGVRLEALSRAADGRFRLSLARGGSLDEVAAGRVVLALPFTLLREVEIDLPLPGVKETAIAELGYGTNAKLMVRFAERLWRSEGGSNGSVLSDLPFQLVWESTRLQPGDGGILVAYGGGRHGVEMGEGTPEEQAVRFAGQLEAVFPGVAAQRTDQVRFQWPSFAWTKGSYACYEPGPWTAFGGAEGERVGNLHFCGEHTSADFQGYMEGAAESGERVAAEIKADLGIAIGEEEAA
jgi:monoamine oxidase